MTRDRTRLRPAREDALMEKKLDAALEATFPASDPYSLNVTGIPADDGRHASPVREASGGDRRRMSMRQTIVLLNELLEGARAVARAAARIAMGATVAPTAAALHDIAGDGARFAAMLSRHIRRLGGTPIPRTGDFFGEFLALEGAGSRLELLSRGQAWVVRKVREALPIIADDELRSDLRRTLEGREQVVRRLLELDPQRHVAGEGATMGAGVPGSADYIADLGASQANCARAWDEYCAAMSLYGRDSAEVLTAHHEWMHLRQLHEFQLEMAALWGTRNRRSQWQP